MSISADEALVAERSDDRPARNDAADFLQKLLADGPVESTEVFRQAKANGIKERTLNRAKGDIGVKSLKLGFGGGWYWSLPNQDGQHGHQDALPQNVAIFDSGGNLGQTDPDETALSYPEDGQSFQDGHDIGTGNVGHLG